ncbi:MAG: 3-dehydroquinate synthase, partial [Candidatus Latescibacteria bacterium]|nr:3-dehydroquinate synthase [Candidatus Latescibacterota bacterium]
AYGLPSEFPPGLDVNETLEAMALDKKALAGKLRFTLPERIGATKLLVEVEREKVAGILSP